MSPAAKSILVFAAYITILGAVLVIVPNPLLVLFGFAPTDEVWIRIVGMLLLCLGYYYVDAARREVASFFRATVLGRACVVACLIGFVVLGLAPPPLLAFAAIDLGGLAWTALALRGGGGRG
jgi:hypothetical protein